MLLLALCGLVLVGCLQTDALKPNVYANFQIGEELVSVMFTQNGSEVSYSVTPSTMNAELYIASLPVDYTLDPSSRCNVTGMSYRFADYFSTSRSTDQLVLRSIVAIAQGMTYCATILPVSAADQPPFWMYKADLLSPWNGRVYIFQPQFDRSMAYLVEHLLYSNEGEGGSNISQAVSVIYGPTALLDADIQYGPMPSDCPSDPAMGYTSMETELAAADSKVVRKVVRMLDDTPLNSRAFGLRDNSTQTIVACARIEPINSAYAGKDGIHSLVQSVPFIATQIKANNILTYNVLEEIGGADVMCMNSMIFNPWSLTPTLGDLSEQPRINDSLPTVPILGSSTIIGRAVYKSGQCGYLIPYASGNAGVVTGVVKFDGEILAGTITLTQLVDTAQGYFGPTFIAVDIGYANESLGTTMGHNWHVHQMPRAPDGTCQGAVGGHYNPYSQNLTMASGYKGQCGTYSSLIGKSQFRCEMGDLAGKHGQLSIGPYNDANRPTYIFYDDTLRLSGSESVLDRSIVIHQAGGSGDYLTCDSLVAPAVESDSVMHITSFILLFICSMMTIFSI